VGLLVHALYLYGWYAAAVIALGLVLVLATWLIHSAIRWWKKQYTAHPCGHAPLRSATNAPPHSDPSKRLHPAKQGLRGEMFNDGR
jgi:hypothetical protein